MNNAAPLPPACFGPATCDCFGLFLIETKKLPISAVAFSRASVIFDQDCALRAAAQI